MNAALQTLPDWAAWLVVGLLLISAVFGLVGAIGLLRLPDFYMRLHAPTTTTTLGVGGALCAALSVRWVQGQWGAAELLITLLLFVTAPVSANLLALAALHLRVPSQAGPPEPDTLSADPDRTNPNPR
jgi:multicomponent K+:H+ antiporter subunit G